MTDKPTDAEIIMLAVELGVSVRTGKGAVKLTRAVLAKWGQPVQAALPNDEQIWAAREAWSKQANEHEAMRAALIAGRASHGQAPAPEDSVQEDAARLDWLLLRVSGAEFRRIGVHYSGNARRADVDAARKQGATP